MKLRIFLGGLTLALLSSIACATSLVVLPQQLVVDGSSEVRSGAKLYVYSAGTVTPRNSYTTPALTVAHANPVISVSTGLFPAIYVDSASGPYKLVLKDADDVTIWTEDNIPVGEDPTYARTADEVTLGITPTDYSYPAGNAYRYGAVCDGSTDDTSALQTWALVTHPLTLPEGTCIVNDRLTFSQNAVVNGAGSGLSILNFDGADGTFTGNRAVDFSQGSFVALPALDGNLAEGDTSIDFVSAHGLAQGDVIQLLDDSTGSWSAFLSTFTKGEFAVVSEVVDADTINLQEPLYDSYTAAATDAFEFDYGTVQMSGVKIIGVGNASTVTTLFASHIAYSDFNDVVVAGGGDRATDIRHSYNVNFNGASLHYFSATPGSLQYGLVLTHVQNIRVDGDFQGERHAVVTGSTTGGGVVNRGVRISGHLKSLIRHAGDFHGNTEYSSFDGVTMNGSVAIGGNHNSVRNATILGNTAIDDGKCIAFRELKGTSFDFSNIFCRSLGDPHATGGQGIIDMGGNDSSTLTVNTTLDGTLSFSNIRIEAPNANAGIRLVNRGSVTAQHSVMIDGVDLRLDSTVDSAFGLIRLDAISGDNFQNYSGRGLTGNDGYRRSTVNFDVDNIIEEHQEITSFTPGIAFGGNVTGITYTHQVGRYEVHGGQVFVTGEVLLSSNGSDTGTATITGLPFTSLNVANVSSTCNIQLSGASFADQHSGIIDANDNAIILQEVTNAGTLSNLTEADLSDTTLARFSCTYFRAF